MDAKHHSFLWQGKLGSRLRLGMGTRNDLFLFRNPYGAEALDQGFAHHQAGD